MSNDTESTAVKRRDFLKILGAAGATAGTIGCSSEKVRNLIPYLIHPDETVSGVSTYYASTCRECAAGCGIIAVKRPSAVVTAVSPPGLPFGLSGYVSVGRP